MLAYAIVCPVVTWTVVSCCCCECCCGIAVAGRELLSSDIMSTDDWTLSGPSTTSSSSDWLLTSSTVISESDTDGCGERFPCNKNKALFTSNECEISLPKTGTSLLIIE